MEYCNEGTLWTIAQQGLTEEMTRHYTRDILIAVDTMHTHGIVHRDIKGESLPSLPFLPHSLPLIPPSLSSLPP